MFGPYFAPSYFARTYFPGSPINLFAGTSLQRSPVDSVAMLANGAPAAAESLGLAAFASSGLSISAALAAEALGRHDVASAGLAISAVENV